MVRILIISLSIFVATLVLTGGTIWHSTWGKIEFSSVDVWAMVLLSLILIQEKKTGIFGFENFKLPIFGKPQTILLLVVTLGLLCFAHILRNESLATHAYDQAMVHQALFWPFSNPPLKCDLCIQGSYLGEHLSYSLLLFAPLTAFLQSHTALYILQMLLLFLPLIAGLFWGPLKNRRDLWLTAFFIVLCHRALRSSLVWDFREDGIAFAGVLISLLALSEKKFLIAFLGLTLALFSKENFSFVLGMSAIPILLDRQLPFSRKQRIAVASITLGLCSLWGWISFHFLIPSWTPVGTGSPPNNIVQRLGQFGSTPPEILKTILFSPSAWWFLIQTKILIPKALKYLLYLLAPVFFFAIYRPLRRTLQRSGRHSGDCYSVVWLIPAVPAVLMNLFSNAETQISLQFHYDLILLPFLIFGLWRGLAAESPAQFRSLAIGILLALSFSGRWPGSDIQKYWPDFSQSSQHAFLQKVASWNEDHTLASSLTALAQLSTLREIREFRVPTQGLSCPAFDRENSRDRTGLEGHSAAQADHIVLDLQDPGHRYFLENCLQSRWIEKARDPSHRFVLLDPVQ